MMTLQRLSLPVFVLTMAAIAPFFSADAAQGVIDKRDGNVRQGPPTPDTCYWTEREFTDLPQLGPRAAKGVILWNHGQAGPGQPRWIRGAPPVIRLFADEGWDVVLVQRNNRCQDRWPFKGGEYVANLVSNVQAVKKTGYRKILVAGQSYGAGTALGAAEVSADIDGVLAFALSHGRGRCRAVSTPEHIEFHEREIRNAIDKNIAPRVLISMGKDDHCEGHSFTPSVSSALAAKEISFIHFDESMALSGHGAATTEAFARLYGRCVVDFFSAGGVTLGKHVCEPVR